MGASLSSADASPEDSSLPVDDVQIHSKARWDALLEASRTSAPRLMVVYFMAVWCGPCRMIDPIFREMVRRYTDVVFVKIDVDELSDVAKAFHVEAMPTFVLVNGGKEVSRVVGANKDELQKKILQGRDVLARAQMTSNEQ